MTPALSPPLLDIENQTPSLDPFLPRHSTFILARAVGRKVKGTEIGNNDFLLIYDSPEPRHSAWGLRQDHLIKS